jgi:hypothetical protein
MLICALLLVVSEPEMLSKHSRRFGKPFYVVVEPLNFDRSEHSLNARSVPSQRFHHFGFHKDADGLLVKPEQHGRFIDGEASRQSQYM